MAIRAKLYGGMYDGEFVFLDTFMPMITKVEPPPEGPEFTPGQPYEPVHLHYHYIGQHTGGWLAYSIKI